MSQKINTSRFYFEFKGHTIPDVDAFRSTTLSLRPDKPIIYLAGDSSLDNKYWVPTSSPGSGVPLPVNVPEIYHAALTRPHPKPDVAFWLNHFLGDRATALNLAVEASTLQERSDDLLEHDKFIRDNIRAEDTLVVSVGSNDIAMRPTISTIRHMLQLAWLTRHSSLEKGTAWCLGYFVRMFKSQVESYVSRLVEKEKPRAVIICMIYYPLEADASNQESWADVPLKLMGYNRFPGQLQTAVRKMYELATKQIRIPGVQVVPCALFESLDGKCEDDYVARVEPSSEGGRKIALQLIGSIDSLITAQTGGSDDTE
ncbi:hypothetical protein O988_07284 [Pseudogymnoascus sp. VKM F-3808]|nr:hypothetical protein O988_07284 [Pseudogymnoascus sp. VKM F-3808]